MFAVPAVVLLISFIFLKPQEYFAVLRSVPILYVVMGLTALLTTIDLRLRLIRAAVAPQLVWVLLFIAWALLTVALHAPHALPETIVGVVITFVPYLVIAHGVQRFRQLQVLAATYVVLTFFLAVVGVEQNFERKECVSFSERTNELRPRDPTGALADGTDCGEVTDCLNNNPEPGVTYFCERRGWLGTSSIGGGRVRYRGNLKDPNELALAVSSGLPFAIGLFLVKRSPFRLLLLVVMIVLGSMTVKFTESRGGILVLATVAAVYLIQRYGKKAIAIALVVLLPAVMVLGGPPRRDADDSKEERLGLQKIGLEFWRMYPIRGVGYNQWGEYHPQTTHNSYILLLAEVGLPGTTLWATAMFVSFKISVQALRRYRRRREARVAFIWSMVSISSMAGVCVGMFFLSFYAHFIPWILVGFNGALSHCIREHDPTWAVRVNGKEVASVAAGVLGFGLAASVVLHLMHT
jgi:hypothetical protein